MQKKYIQYSKRLTTAIMIFWMVARITSFILVSINPDAGTHIVSLINGIDDIAMVNVLAYTGNSVSQKISTSYFKYKGGNNTSQEQEEKEENG